MANRLQAFALFASALVAQFGWTSSATAQASLPPVVTFVYNPGTVTQGQESLGTVTIANPNATPLTGLTFSNNFYSAGLKGVVQLAGATCPGLQSVSESGYTSGPGTLGGGASCFVNFKVTSDIVGTHINELLVRSNEASAAPASATLVVTPLTPPTVAIAFSPASVAVNQQSRKTITLTNPNNFQLTGVAFNDDLQAAGLTGVVAIQSGTCTGTQTVSANTFALSGATLAPGASCSVNVLVSSTVVGMHTNATSVTTNETPAGSGSGSLNVTPVAAPTVTLTFNPAAIASGGQTTGSVTITNPNTVGLTNVGLTAFPAANTNFVVAIQAGTCNGTQNVGANSFTLSGASLAPGATCNLSFLMTSTTPGSYTQQATVTSSEAPSGAATATFTVGTPTALPPTVSYVFNPVTVPANQESTGSVTITNPNLTSLTSVVFTASFTAAGLTGIVALQSGTCTGLQSVSATTYFLSGQTLAPGASCVVSFKVKSAISGPHVSNIEVTSKEAAPAPASATLTVSPVAGPTVVTTFSPATVPSGQQSRKTFTLTNPNTTPLTGITFSDDLAAAGLTAVVALQSGTCSGLQVVSASNYSLQNQTLAPGASCSVSILVSSTGIGAHTNQITITSNEAPATTSSATLTVVPFVPVTASVVFNPATITSGDQTTATVTLTNPNGSSITGIGLSAFYPANVTGLTNPLAGTCNGTENRGATAYILSGATLAAGATCTVSFRVTSSTPATYVQSVSTTSTQTPSGGGQGSFVVTPAPAPAVTAVSPSSGSTSGGQVITITGTNFFGTTAVKFGTANAIFFSVNSSTTITATAPAGTGTVDVTVTTPAGTSAISAADKFTYVAPPTVTSIAPNTGLAAGGTSVTITGTNFTGATAVRFGSAAATSFTVNSATLITAVSPAGSGTVDVTVLTPGGSSPVTAADQFTYIPAPVVSAVSPQDGPVAGGTVVTIFGTGFTGATAVRFGAANATSFTVDSATRITATSPPGSGIVDVTVTGPTGTSVTNANDKFTYVGQPVVTSIAPASGLPAGGTSVTITGSNFTNITGVRFGAVSATFFSVTSPTSITATSPAGVGTVDVTVTNAVGTSATSAADQFTYAAPPTLASISPNTGPSTGGTSVTITGTGFTAGATVAFGANAATSVTFVNATQLTAISPAGSGTVDVRVTTAGGTSPVVAADNFSYTAVPPTVASIAPNSGPSTGGTAVTITGANFTGATSVTIGGAAASGVTVVNATTITATTPAGAVGPASVVVTTPGGSNAPNTLFTYTAPAPTVASIAPNAGPSAGGTSVTITGTNFTGATAVKFGAVSAASFAVNSATSITATSPAGTGTVDVTVTTPTGTSPTSAANQFTYTVGPVVTTNPASQTVAAGANVTFTAAATGAPTPTVQWQVSTNNGGSFTNISGATNTTLTFATQATDNGNQYRAVFTNSVSSANTSAATLTVNTLPVVATNPASQTVLAGSNVTFTASANGTPAPTVQWQVSTNGGGTFTNIAGATTTTLSFTAQATDTGNQYRAVFTNSVGSVNTTAATLTVTPIQATTTTIASSLNPSIAGQAVTFTANVTAVSGTPTGNVTFSDGGIPIGTAALAGGVATFTTSALTVGTHAITAKYAGVPAFTASTSAALSQVVGAPADSVRLRQLQVLVTPTVAQVSGQAITGAIDTAIGEAFSGGGSFVTPNGGGVRFNFAADPEAQSDAPGMSQASTQFGPRNNDPFSNVSGSLNATGRGVNTAAANANARLDESFGALGYAKTPPRKAPPLAESRDWFGWAEIRGAVLDRWNTATLFGVPTTTASMLYGNQVNMLAGLTRKITPNFLIGVVGGYETFDYRSDTLAGRLKGDGWSVGAYAGWLITSSIRADAALVYSGIGYDGTSGLASGSFTGKRILASGGITGNYEIQGIRLEPSARVYALWERENAYTDTLGTLQTARDFSTGRASAGLKAAYPIAWSDTVTIAPYAGLYADYYFNKDNAGAIGVVPGAVPTGLAFDGWSGRAVGGVSASFNSGAQISVGAERSGLGGNLGIWVYRARGSLPFSAQ